MSNSRNGESNGGSDGFHREFRWPENEDLIGLAEEAGRLTALPITPAVEYFPSEVISYELRMTSLRPTLATGGSGGRC